MYLITRVNGLSAGSYELILQTDDIGETRQALQSPAQQGFNALILSETLTVFIFRSVDFFPDYSKKTFPWIENPHFAKNPLLGQLITMFPATSASRTEIINLIFEAGLGKLTFLDLNVRDLIICVS